MREYLNKYSEILIRSDINDKKYEILNYLSPRQPEYLSHKNAYLVCRHKLILQKIRCPCPLAYYELSSLTQDAPGVCSCMWIVNGHVRMARWPDVDGSPPDVHPRHTGHPRHPRHPRHRDLDPGLVTEEVPLDLDHLLV